MYPMYARAAANLALRDKSKPGRLAQTIGEPEDRGDQWAFRWGVGDEPFLDSPMVLVHKETLEVSFG